MHVYPDYYKDFFCIAGECKHNCCIGWEIDIDEDTAERYKNIGGEFGKRLENNISKGENPHFILGERERCPFLNGQNLCDIICELGEGALCAICAEHPRFHNELPHRVESGLGLTCEAAGRLILGRKTPLTLVGGGETDDEIIILRDKVLEVLTNREKNLDVRISHMLTLVGAQMPVKSLSEWAEIY
ncbi:MAG: flagellin lysine-N-methylase, partial [Clostridia bacterium]|nr:flagellin lysine-N-methylase [Clostridia bacterium]